MGLSLDKPHLQPQPWMLQGDEEGPWPPHAAHGSAWSQDLAVACVAMLPSALMRMFSSSLSRDKDVPA